MSIIAAPLCPAHRRIVPITRTPRAVFRAALLGGALLVGGCSTWQTYLPDIRQFGVYKLDINQGNYVTQDMVEKLKVGQTKPQVRLVLGTALVMSAFRDNRWDYIYEYSRQGKRLEHRQFTLYFVDDKLARWEGDDVPVSAAQLNRIAADRELAPQPSADDQGMLQRFLEILKGNW